MKGKDNYTSDEIKKLKELIRLRNNTPSFGQKAIRDKMRGLGFYGKVDWGITNLQLADLQVLITSGLITVIGSNAKATIPIRKAVISKIQPNVDRNIGSDILSILNAFRDNCFNPMVDTELKVANQPGIYLICLKKGAKLPKTDIIPTFASFEGLSVIYTGIASLSLRTRDYKQHFKGNNAGRSTLRKSLGVLFGYRQIPRDADPGTGKTKFSIVDEEALTKWMHSNLCMYFLPTSDYKKIELELINHFNPALNLKDNKSSINSDFRQFLSRLRCDKGR